MTYEATRQYPKHSKTTKVPHLGLHDLVFAGICPTFQVSTDQRISDRGPFVQDVYVGVPGDASDIRSDNHL